MDSSTDGLFEAANLKPGRYDIEVSYAATVTSTLDTERVINLPVNYRAAVDNSAFRLIGYAAGRAEQ